MNNFDPKKELARQRALARLERNKQIRERTRELRNQKHPPRLRRQFKPKRADGRRNNRGNASSMHAAPRCARLNNSGAPCGAPAERGSMFCHRHNNPNAYAFQVQKHGRRCSAISISGGGPCKNPAAKGFTVCWQHGAKAELTRRAIVAAGDTPMAYAARKRKQAAHRARAAQYRSGEREAAKESWPRFLKRQQREAQAEQRRSASYDDFREQRAPAMRPLRPLYPA
jgi:hypothetical protein